MNPKLRDAWSSGNPYEQFMGRWSAALAREFLKIFDWDQGMTWLDLGCGTGSLSAAIVDQCEVEQLIAIDPSEQFVAFTQQRLTGSAADIRVGAAENIPLPDGVVDYCVSGLVINFVDSLELAVSEMKRVVKPNGKVGIYVWDYAEGMQMLRTFWDAVVALDPAAASLDEANRFPICREGGLAELMRSGQLKDVQEQVILCETAFASFDDYWRPFEGLVGPAPAYLHSLDEDQRKAIKQKLQSDLPLEADGSIRLTAKAWLASATVV